MKKNYFANAKNITNSIKINLKDGNLSRDDNISTENKNQRRYSFNSSLNYPFDIQNQRQIQHNINEARQVNDGGVKKENQRIIINSRRNKLLEINNNVNNNLNRKVYDNINNNVHNRLNNNVNNHSNNNINNHINNNYMNNNQLDSKNGVNNNGIRKNAEKFQNHSFYSSKYSNKKNKISDISDSESSHTNRTAISEPLKKKGNYTDRKKEEEDTKNLVRKITKLINAIESDRMDRKVHTKAINAQTKAINAQTEEIKAQTEEMRKQNEKLITLMTNTMTELNLNVKKLVDKNV